MSAWSPLLQDAVSTQGGDGFLQHSWRPATQGLEDGVPGICPTISPLLTSRPRPESQSSPAGWWLVLRRPLLATLGNHAASWTWPGAPGPRKGLVPTDTPTHGREVQQENSRQIVL